MLRISDNMNSVKHVSLLFLASVFLSAAGIRGVVYHRDTHESMENVNLNLVGTGIGAISDRNGFFGFSDLPAGHYILKARHIGFASWSLSLELSEHEIVTLEIPLKPAAVKLDSVIVSAPMNSPGNSLGQDYLTSTLMLRLPSVGEPDVLRAIQTLPGIVPTNDFNTGFYVRGGNRDQNLILMDDIPVFNPYHLLGIFSTFDPDAIQSVVIQKGNIQPEYGNHLSSVVNINLRDGKASAKSINVNASLVSTRIRGEGPLNKGSYMVTLRRTYLDWIVDGLRALQLLPESIVLPYHFMDGVGKVIYRPTPTSKLRLSTYFGTDVYDLSKLDQDTTENKLIWNNRAVGLAYDAQLSPQFRFHASLSFSRFNTQWLPTDTVSTIQINNAIRLWQLKSFITRRFSGDYVLQIGIEPQFYVLEFDIAGLSYTPLHLGRDVFTEQSAFIRAKVPVSTVGQMEVGDRFTYFQYQDVFRHSPSARLSVSLPGDARLTLGWNRTNQGIMTVGNEEVLLTMFEAWLPIPKDLSVMTADQVSIGVARTPVTGLTMGAEIYDRTFRRIVEFNTQKYTPEEPDFVAGTGQSRGMELYFRKDYGPVRTLLAYTLSKTKKTIQGLTYTPRFDRTHDLSIYIRHPLGHAWRLGWRFVYQTGTPYTAVEGFYTQYLPPNVIMQEVPLYGKRNSRRLPDYHRLDMNLSREVTIRGKTFTLYLDWINIYGRLNILRYDSINNAEIQMPPLITIGFKTQ